jgi:hypothetical protein
MLFRGGCGGKVDILGKKIISKGGGGQFFMCYPLATN